MVGFKSRLLALTRGYPQTDWMECVGITTISMDSVYSGLKVIGQLSQKLFYGPMWSYDWIISSSVKQTKGLEWFQGVASPFGNPYRVFTLHTNTNQPLLGQPVVTQVKSEILVISVFPSILLF